jgi:hypothetical protein
LKLEKEVVSHAQVIGQMMIGYAQMGASIESVVAMLVFDDDDPAKRKLFLQHVEKNKELAFKRLNEAAKASTEDSG